MHDTAYKIGEAFIKSYVSEGQTIVEVGSLNVNGTLRDAASAGILYLGLDYDHGPDVDIVARPKQALPIRSNFCDALVSSSQMEHDPRFWVTFLEFCRITKPGGFIYLNAPSNGPYHSFPIDVWRFYPDAGMALADWANENGHQIELIESFWARREKEIWTDFVAVFYVGKWPEGKPVTYISERFSCYNIRKHGVEGIIDAIAHTEDMVSSDHQSLELSTLREEIMVLQARLEKLSDQSINDQSI